MAYLALTTLMEALVASTQVGSQNYCGNRIIHLSEKRSVVVFSSLRELQN